MSSAVSIIHESIGFPDRQDSSFSELLKIQRMDFLRCYSP